MKFIREFNKEEEKQAKAVGRGLLIIIAFIVWYNLKDAIVGLVVGLGLISFSDPIFLMLSVIIFIVLAIKKPKLLWAAIVISTFSFLLI